MVVDGTLSDRGYGQRTSWTNILDDCKSQPQAPMGDYGFDDMRPMAEQPQKQMVRIGPELN
jgi:hypothetical protein